MKLSKTAEYALSIMAQLASAKSVVSVKTLHERLNIPFQYTSKTLRMLYRSNLVITEQGREGGYRLSRSAETIMLSDIVEAVEPGYNYVNCIMGRDRCDSDKPCALHEQWAKPREQIRRMLQETTLSSIS
ncbi:Rrf2 family transcriptional regulator [Sulfurimonas sp. HSL-1656]|uniref:RrF2 family transcriptional regulator n=1 Tax=Thiomicrolovo TaxID=3451667 RepID=UPI0031F9A50E